MFFFTVGAHLSNFNPIVYYDRLVDIQQQVVEYKKVSPESLVFYKPPTFMRGNLKEMWSTVNNFVARRMREICLRVFKDSEVIVYDPWDMVEVLFDHLAVGNLHPGVNKFHGNTGWIIRELTQRFVNLIVSLTQ